MILDSLTSARRLHRVLLGVALWTLLLALALVPTQPRIADLEAVRNLLRSDFRAYDEFTRGELDLHIAERRADFSRWLLDTLQTESPTDGFGRITERIVTPVDVSHFTVIGTTLADVGNTTIDELQSPELRRHFWSPIVIFAVSFPTAISTLETTLVPYIREQIPIDVRVPEPETADWTSNDRRLVGTPLFSVRQWPELPGREEISGPISMLPLPLTIPVHVDRVELRGTAFIDWVNALPGWDNVISMGFCDLISPEHWRVPTLERGETLEQLHANLTSEVSAVDPRRQQVALFGAQVPVLLMLLASPVLLLVLSFAFAMHAMHLARQTDGHTEEIAAFAWLPLTLQSNPSWIVATSTSSITMPTVSFLVLWHELTALEGIDAPFDPAVRSIAAILIAAFGAVGMVSVDAIRDKLGKASMRATCRAVD